MISFLNLQKDKNNKKNLDKQAENEPQSDSGSGDDANLLSSPDSQKLHVEFSEAEIIESDTNTVTVKVIWKKINVNDKAVDLTIQNH